MSVAYRVAPIFLIRLPGAPFEAIEALGTPATFAAARALAARRNERDHAIAQAEEFFKTPERLLSEEAFRALRSAIRARQVPKPIAGTQPSVFTDYAEAAAAVSDLESKLDAALEGELQSARGALWDWSRKLLPHLLVFGIGGVRELLANLWAPPGVLPRRNARAGDRERHLLLYLQRVCTKNDTFSQFGPTVWGRIDDNPAITFKPRPGIAARETFFERWTAHALAAAMNADPEVFAELAPRLHPNAEIDQGAAVSGTGELVPLSPDDLEIIRRCDGKARVFALKAVDRVRALTEAKILQCEIAVPALEPRAFDVLCDDVREWRDGEVRQRWLKILDELAGLPLQFAEATEAPRRQEIMDTARARLHSVGASRETGNRALYSASNPIGEECFRNCEFQVSPDCLNQAVVEAAPWIDLWRDSYAFIASRVAAGLRGIFEKSSPRDGAVPLPEFLRNCEQAKLSLQGPGLVALAVVAFQEVKAAFRERIQPHAGQEEYELTADDCHVVRNNFTYPKFDEYTYPSADLQLSAASADAVSRGEYEWILAELHPPVALLHHCMYWSCPDKKTLHAAFAQTVFGKPNFHFGFLPADFTAHTSVHIFDALPEVSNFVAAQRGNPKWRSIRPAEAEVYIDEETGDVAVRETGSRQYLGSFARAWVIPLGFHPFQFGLVSHTPRLRCGRVIVQRRAWTVAATELPAGDYTGVSRDLVTAIEQLRAQKGWPRYIYIRPTEQALRRSGVEGRDKDTKPVFVDLESYLFLEIFHRWLMKAGELEITEMLPDPEHLLWREPDGRRTFELRTLVVPAP